MENAYMLLAQWRRQAKREGKTEEEIKKVLKEAQSGDYENLLIVLASN